MKLYKTILLMSSVTILTACNSFLDETPDNRATINKEDDVKALVTTAYSSVSPCLINELMSDNMDDYGESNPYTDRFYDHVYHWEDADEENNESPGNFWDNQFAAIAAANQALKSIEDMGGCHHCHVARNQGRSVALPCIRLLYAHQHLLQKL